MQITLRRKFVPKIVFVFHFMAIANSFQHSRRLFALRRIGKHFENICHHISRIGIGFWESTLTAGSDQNGSQRAQCAIAQVRTVSRIYASHASSNNAHVSPAQFCRCCRWCQFDSGSKHVCYYCAQRWAALDSFGRGCRHCVPAVPAVSVLSSRQYNRLILMTYGWEVWVLWVSVTEAVSPKLTQTKSDSVQMQTRITRTEG